ncbi:hypothetical protein QOL99_02080 [Deinococcus sp. MIMF12]|uniref:Uncharacterized protein n=1 Tax=Deinococcus rhizophilus TaxID=3049544 RepID=A0ABT7JD00_9DEIO|nr:hypothetical protein [Deinococcus rhizophilus]MDL2342931.1 hypothetical protein [Deinococcus rhizophilus]
MTPLTLPLLALLLLGLGGLARREARRDEAWRPLAAVLLALGGLTLAVALLWLMLAAWYIYATPH